MAKLNINFQAGIIEIEGEEKWAQQMYEDFKKNLLELKATTNPPLQTKTQKKQQAVLGKVQKKYNNRESYSLIKDLDLSKKEDAISLKEYYSQKRHKSAMENNVIFVYYLQKIRGAQDISPNHIYTCYKDVGTRFPGALRQSLVDTAARKGWIDTRKINNILITTLGENAVEHDLILNEKENG